MVNLPGKPSTGSQDEILEYSACINAFFVNPIYRAKKYIYVTRSTGCGGLLLSQVPAVTVLDLAGTLAAGYCWCDAYM